VAGLCGFALDPALDLGADAVTRDWSIASALTPR